MIAFYDGPVTGERKIFLVKLFDTRREGDSFHLEKLHMTEKESPIEIVEMEMEMARFLKKGVTKITRDGKWGLCITQKWGGTIFLKDSS